MTHLWRETALSIAKRHPVDPAQNKTVLITGASSGIGLSCAVAMAKSGWRVICAVRSPGKMNDIIKTLGPVGPGQLEVMELDLASFTSVRTFASTLLAREDVPRIDVLMLNAGLVPSWAVTKDGYESGFQTCHLSHHLLTRLLEDRVVAAAPSRIVVVSSVGHTQGTLKYDWPAEGHKGFHSDSSKGFNFFFQYAQSKLANLHFALIIGERLKDKGVTTLTLHPGAVNSSIWPPWMIGRSLFMLSNDQGAATSAFLATDPRFGSSKDLPVATYWIPSRFGNPHQVKTSKMAKDHATAERLWNVTEEIIKAYL